MIYLINKNVDPAINHGIEEYFMKETNEDVFSLWQNDRTVLLGKNQDAYAEMDIDYAKANDLKVVRRLSGGGTIYCDLGNMQYSFITNDDRKVLGTDSFAKFAEPIVEALRSLDMDAEFTGRNDIVLEGCKISGNAQYRYKDRIIHHGTLLYSSDKETLSNVLYSRPIKFQNKAVKSVSARVGEIKVFVDMDIESFMDYIIQAIIDHYGIEKVVNYDDLSDEVKARIDYYAERFRDEEWNLGKNLDETHHSFSIKHSYGLVEYKLRCKEGIIDSLYILGDYFEDEDVEILAKALIGTKLDEASLEARLKDFDISSYVKGMDQETLIKDLISIE